MKTRNAAISATLLLASLAGTAEAELVIDVYQVGSNVEATGSGSLDLAGLTDYGSASPIPGVIPTVASIIIGPPGTGESDDIYVGFSGPTNFGEHRHTVASSGTGDLMGISGGVGDILVPGGYVSGAALSGSATFDNTTIAGMLLTPGTYTYTWGSGLTADSLTVNIAVPEPSSLAMAGIAVAAGLIVAVRRRRA
jgi:hypothetical protein